MGYSPYQMVHDFLHIGEVDVAGCNVIRKLDYSWLHWASILKLLCWAGIADCQELSSVNCLNSVSESALISLEALSHWHWRWSNPVYTSSVTPDNEWIRWRHWCSSFSSKQSHTVAFPSHACREPRHVMPPMPLAVSAAGQLTSHENPRWCNALHPHVTHAILTFNI